MKKNLTIFGAILIVTLLSLSCGNENQNIENTDSTEIEAKEDLSNEEIESEATDETVETKETLEEPAKDGSQTVTAKLVSAGSLEGDADFTFVKEDGSKIVFYRNYMSDKEPELKYNLIGEDGASANPQLVGKTFVIKFRVNPKGRQSMITGDYEPCNQILSLEKK